MAKKPSTLGRRAPGRNTGSQEAAQRRLQSVIAAPQTQVAAPPVAGVTFGHTGAQFPAELSIEDWVAVGQHLAEIGKAYQWSVADWVLYGQNKYGDKYAEAMERTGFAYQTIANIVSVARKIEFSRRRENLPFSHHAEVAQLDAPQADQLLQKAESERWTARQTREAAQRIVQRSKQGEPQAPKGSAWPALDRLVDEAERVARRLPASDVVEALSKVHRLRQTLQRVKKEKE